MAVNVQKAYAKSELQSFGYIVQGCRDSRERRREMIKPRAARHHLLKVMIPLQCLEPCEARSQAHGKNMEVAGNDRIKSKLLWNRRSKDNGEV